jgi:hypothetical protein
VFALERTFVTSVDAATHGFVGHGFWLLH